MFGWTSCARQDPRGAAAAACLVLVGWAGDAPAQEPSPVALRGTVSTDVGRPAVGVDVFLLETLEGVATDPDGGFVLHSSHRGPSTVVIHGPGILEFRVRVDLPRAEPVSLVVHAEPVNLAPITVQAGRYAAGPADTGELTPLEVVSIPGANADVLQAVAAFPGVQPVTEGAALFVRGGDVSETKVVLDGAVVLAPYRFEAGPIAFGTFDPFELEGISFSSGGFAARHGDALSALVELETAGVPQTRQLRATASLAALAGQIEVPLSADLGFRATANRSHTGPMFRLNRHDAEFIRAPESRNASASATWAYRPAGRLKLYAFDEWNRFTMEVSEPAYTGEFAGDDASGLAVLSLRDAAGDIGIDGSVSISRRRQRQGFGVFELEEQDRLAQGRLELAGVPGSRLFVRGGANVEARWGRVAGSYPETGEDVRPGARATVFGSDLRARRVGLFTEAQVRLTDRLQATAGIRADRSTLARAWTWDPRLSGAYRLGEGAHLTFAWGRYHQVPAPLLYEPEVGTPNLPSQAGSHRVVGAVMEGDGRLLRLEAYDKGQSQLAAMNRDHRVRGGGRGRARGVDVFARGPGPFGTVGRASYSFIDAERTDPDTGETARSPYEIRHALNLLLDRPVGERWKVSTAIRHATGRPYTPVIGATRPDSEGAWEPEYGVPWSERLPSYTRLDLSGQFLHSFGGDDLVVVFVSLTNLLDRVNAAAPQYNTDYSEMNPLAAAYRRTLYFGVTAVLPF